MRSPFIMFARIVAVVASGVVVWAGSALATPLSCAEASSQAAKAVRAGRNAEAVQILEASVGRPACAALAIQQAFMLARATEKLAEDDPEAACRAEARYRDVLALGPKARTARAAGEGAERMKAQCSRCRSATDAIADADWPKAERQTRDDLADADCAADLSRLKVQLAQVVERQTVDAPERACEAATLYAEAQPSDGRDPVAKAGHTRMQTACTAHRAALARAEPTAKPDPDPPEPKAEPDPGLQPPVDAPPDRTLAWVTSAAAGVALVGGGALLYWSTVEQADLDDIRGEYRAAYSPPDAAAWEKARQDFEDQKTRPRTFNLAGWGALAVGAGLGAWATMLWLDSPTVQGAVGPNGASVSVRF